MSSVVRAALFRGLPQLVNRPDLVGLTEQSALSRAGRRWFGQSPRALRRGWVRAPGVVFAGPADPAKTTRSARHLSS